MSANLTLEDLLKAWRVNNAVTLELLEFCPDDSLEEKPGKGKTIRSNFSHIVSVRGEYVKEKFPKLAVPRIDWKSASRAEIRDALVESSKQVEELLRKRHEKPGKMGLLTFFAYMVSHDAHHRSQIEIALRLSGKEPSDEKVWYEWWDWSSKG